MNPKTQELSRKAHDNKFREQLNLLRIKIARSSVIKMLIFVIACNLIFCWVFMIIEDKPFHESLYWATDTLTNTGTGLAALDSPAAWFLTTFLMWVGLGVTLYFIEYFYLRLLNKEKKVLKLKNHILLIGWNHKIRYYFNNLPGKLGVDHTYVCIADIKEIPYDLPNIVMFIQGSPDEERILKKASIETASQAIIALEDDSDTILTTMTAQDLNPNIKLSVNIKHAENIKHLERIGVEQIICDEKLVGDALTDSIK